MRKLLLMMIFFVPLIIPLFVLHAEDDTILIDTQASSSVVPAGDIFTIKITISGKGKSSISDMPKIEHVYIQQAGVMQNFSWVNGKQSSSTVFDFLVQIVKPGEYYIGPFKVLSEGKSYTTKAVKIKVVEASESSGSDDEEDQTAPNYFAELEVEKENVYAGEWNEVTLYFFMRARLRNFDYNGLSYPPTAWIESLESKENYVGKAERKGLMYEVYELEKKRIFVSQEGKYTIPGAVIKFDGIKNSRFQSLFRDSLSVTTENKEIEVVPLPDEAPEGFNGAVGDFSYSSDISGTSIKVKDSATVKIVLEGEGNFHEIEDVGCTYDGAIEEYSSKSSVENKNKTYKVKNWEILLVPTEAGSYTIKTDDFVYFSLNEKQYKTIKGTEYTITVEKGRQDETVENIIIQPEEKEQVTPVEEEIMGNGKDIQFITTRIGRKRPVIGYKSGMNMIFISYIVFFLLLICYILLKYVLFQRWQNSAAIRQRKAYRVFNANLSEIAAFSKKKNPPHTEIVDKISKAVEHYFSRKFEIDSVEFTTRGIREKLSSVLSEENLFTLKDFIVKLDMIRFGGMDIGHDEVIEFMDEIRAFIRTIDLQKDSMK